ncbi:hypothetical protein [Mammaliicoccus phage vB_MscM-PMS3]|nr:hypothetical protein [Mammaliicoccus phage vB_MscM-PMS3]WBF82254.1 hypothetical protein [Mammaliicoccus virus vB_MscM-PMS2]
MKLHLETNIVEGTPKEITEYLRLAEEGDKTKLPLFSFGHAHQPTNDTFQSFFGSIKIDKSSIGVRESLVYDEGAFYVTTSEGSESFLPVGIILKHHEGKTFKDSIGLGYIISNTSYVKRVDSEGDVIRKDRFELAKQLGIQLTSTTDFAVESSNRKFKVKGYCKDFKVGDIVTITGDDGDNLPQCKDKYSNFSYVYLHDLETIKEDLEEGEDDELLGYRYWYLEGTTFNKFVVLEVSPKGYFEDSTGKRYTYQAVSSHVKPIDRENASKYFERSKDRGYLLKYYPAADVFTD